MSKYILWCLKQFEEVVKEHAGVDAWLPVQEHLHGVGEQTKLEEVATRVWKAVKALEKTVDGESFAKAMYDRGCGCANSHLNDIEKQKREFKKHGSLGRYIDSLVEAKIPGICYYRGGENELYLVYRAKELGMRCYCPLLRKLPDELLLPPSYCECSRAFVQYTWEQVLEKDVRVEFLESCLSGKDECRFVITMI